MVDATAKKSILRIPMASRYSQTPYAQHTSQIRALGPGDNSHPEPLSPLIRDSTSYLQTGHPGGSAHAGGMRWPVSGLPHRTSGSTVNVQGHPGLSEKNMYEVSSHRTSKYLGGDMGSLSQGLGTCFSSLVLSWAWGCSGGI